MSYALQFELCRIIIMLTELQIWSDDQLKKQNFWIYEFIYNFSEKFHVFLLKDLYRF